MSDVEKIYTKEDAERLCEIAVAAHKAASERIPDWIPKIREALKNCADDLESEIEARYGEAKNHPAMRIRYERDMETVQAARKALSLLQAEKKI